MSFWTCRIICDGGEEKAVGEIKRGETWDENREKERKRGREAEQERVGETESNGKKNRKVIKERQSGWGRHIDR